MKNIKNIKIYWKYSSRDREVGEDPDSLPEPEPEHLNRLQTPHDLSAGPLLLLLSTTCAYFVAWLCSTGTTSMLWTHNQR